MWHGGLWPSLSVATPFGLRRNNDRTIIPFPPPAHQKGHADFLYPALGQDKYGPFPPPASPGLPGLPGLPGNTGLSATP